MSKNYITSPKTLFIDLSNITFKIGILIRSFNPNLKHIILKSTEELSVVTIKNEAKFEDELTCHFKADMRNLTNSDPST